MSDSMNKGFSHSQRKKSVKKESPAELDTNFEVFVTHLDQSSPLSRSGRSMGDLRCQLITPPIRSIPVIRVTDDMGTDTDLPKPEIVPQITSPSRMSRGLSSPQLTKQKIKHTGPKRDLDTVGSKPSVKETRPKKKRGKLTSTLSRLSINGAISAASAPSVQMKKKKKAGSIKHSFASMRAPSDLIGFGWTSPRNSVHSATYESRYDLACDIIEKPIKLEPRKSDNPVKEYKRSQGISYSSTAPIELEISEEHIKRFRIIQELRDTERSYVTSLHMITVFFLTPLKKYVNTPQQLLSSKEIKGIFGNIEDVCIFSQTLLESFEVRIHPSAWTDQSTIGDIFNSALDNPNMSDIYHQYVDTYEKALSKIRIEFNNENSLFGTFAKKCQVKCDNHSLSSLLVSPVQRIPRYQLLLEDLIKATPRYHKDSPLLILAHKKMVALASSLNESKWREESQQRMLEISRMFKKGFHSNLNVKGRELLVQVYFFFNID